MSVWAIRFNVFMVSRGDTVDIYSRIQRRGRWEGRGLCFTWEEIAIILNAKAIPRCKTGRETALSILIYTLII